MSGSSDAASNIRLKTSAFTHMSGALPHGALLERTGSV